MRSFFPLLLMTCYIMASPVFALTNEKLWADLNINGPLSDSKKTYYNLRNSSRFINQAHGVETALFSAELGHVLRNHFNLWLGYQWQTPNLISSTPQEHRFWQQLIWDMLQDDNMMLSSRTRLEERFQDQSPGTAWRLRQRMTLRLQQAVLPSIYPLAWEELFINLNHPSWVNSGSINQNRLFAGVNILKKHHFWELGYLNQYRLGQTQNTLSHILYIGLTVRT
ncbi:DUF2490 domain-containing protein [Legionella sp. CNM-4043-24]|uniref:DUF2490 domain-containing protein n=1 Tax=Legionella sp. CNM-4043-24 TaxID=3421646 RepID=UPI00403AC846